ncbi:MULTISPECIES: hypothetical protein [unclassified Dolichospermum]|uniref:hypothetical protein n=1 Tax=unclassified Dolichospermum TaxID=2622029 RepID=UPI001880A41E|nr:MULTISPECIES: hypothetical protein [unclassified Dolichospermum]MBE9248591.1 hypothetical protein [Dolichospermum sp. LEGE 00240]MBE9256306.1 hypothetical protein [Dolichospermum sp. LEGE 00246]
MAINLSSPGVPGVPTVVDWLSMIFSTAIAKISLADVPALSVAIALTLKFPTLSLVGVSNWTKIFI